MPIDRTLDPGDLLERLLDKGIILDVWRRAMPSGLDLSRQQVHVVPPDRPVEDSEEPAPLRTLRAAFQAWNDRNVDGYVSLLHPRYLGLVHAAGAPIRGRRAARRAMHRFVHAFPDLSFQIVGALAAGNSALVSWLARGTPRGSPGESATLPRLEVHGCTIGDITRGRIVSDWTYWDTTDMIDHLAPRTRREADDPQAGDRLSATS